MRRENQIRQIKLLETRLDAGTTVDAGGLMKNPTSVYVDAELAEREWREFFTGHPQVIGLSGDLPDTGAFITIDDLAAPILATRGEDGRFRAFVNSCRHRGALVESRERGTRGTFGCPFHNWTYGLDGALNGLPKSDHFGDVETSCLGLIELPTEERYGLLWLHPNPRGRIDVEALLGDELCDEFESWDFAKLRYLGGDTYDVACNWKLAMDTFGETYHFPVLHSNTINLAFHGNVQCYDTFGRNHRMLLCRREIDEMLRRPESEWSITKATLPAYWLFPNIQILPSDFDCFLVRAYPIAGDPGRHVSRISFYLWPDTEENSEREGFLREIAETFAQIIRDEDYVMSASQQRAANSGALAHVVFGRNEPALHFYHSTYRSALGMAPLPLLSEADVTG